MRRLLPLLLAAAAACGAGADGPPCKTDPSFDRSPVFKVRLENRPTEIKRPAFSELQSVLPTSVQGQTQGLTEVEHNLAVRSRLGFSGKAPACSWFEEVVVDLTPAAVRILAPSEYADDSCEYAAVLEHEREHERVHRELLDETASELRFALAAADWLPAKGNPIELPDRKAAEEELPKRLDKVVRPVYEKFRARLEEQQAELDKPGHYEWAKKRCKGWK